MTLYPAYLHRSLKTSSTSSPSTTTTTTITSTTTSTPSFTSCFLLTPPHPLFVLIPWSSPTLLLHLGPPSSSALLLRQAHRSTAAMGRQFGVAAGRRARPESGMYQRLRGAQGGEGKGVAKGKSSGGNDGNNESRRRGGMGGRSGSGSGSVNASDTAKGKSYHQNNHWGVRGGNIKRNMLNNASQEGTNEATASSSDDKNQNHLTAAMTAFYSGYKEKKEEAMQVLGQVQAQNQSQAQAQSQPRAQSGAKIQTPEFMAPPGTAPILIAIFRVNRALASLVTPTRNKKAKHMFKRMVQSKWFDFWVFFQCVLVCFIYVVTTFKTLHPAFIVVIRCVELAVSALVCYELVIRWWIHGFDFGYILRPYVAIDVLASLPAFQVMVNILASPHPLKALASPKLFFVKSSFLSILRLFRAFRIIRTSNRKYGLLAHLKDHEIRMLRVFYTLTAMIFVWSSLIYNVEHLAQPQHFRNFFDAFYYTVGLMIGYNEYGPITDKGRVITTCAILCGVTVIPWQIGNLIRNFVVAQAKQEVLCPTCGLMFHDPDARFCKNCGETIYQEHEGDII